MDTNNFNNKEIKNNTQKKDNFSRNMMLIAPTGLIVIFLLVGLFGCYLIKDIKNSEDFNLASMFPLILCFFIGFGGLGTSLMIPFVLFFIDIGSTIKALIKKNKPLFPFLMIIFHALVFLGTLYLVLTIGNSVI